MGGLFGGGKSTSTVAEKLANIQLQTSSYGGCLAIIYGTNRVAANLIDYDDFTAVPHTTTQTVGKGGGGSTMSQTTYTYTAGVIMALCEGPIVSINRVWVDKEIGSMAGYGFTLLTGTRPQSPWSTWLSKHPTKALGYSGMALVCHAAIDLGSSGTMKNHSFEVQGFLATEQDPNATTAYDAKPSAVIVDFLTNVYYGAGWDASRIADLVTGAASYQTYCTACGFAISPNFKEQKAAGEHLKDLLDATNSEALWSGGASGMVLKVIPYGDTPITANGASYVPNTTPLYDLTYDDFLGVVDEHGKPTGNDAITITRTSTQDVMNCHPVEYLNRLNDYNVDVVEDPDPADVSLSGLKKAQPLTLHMVTRSAHALQISRIKAQREVYIRNTYTFKVGWKYLLLEPMDLVTLTDPLLGLDHHIVRIVSVDMPEETSEKDGLTITAEEWPFGTGTATLYTTQNTGGTVPNVNADPGAAAAPLVINSPALWAQDPATPEVALFTAGGALWGGCEVWVSTTGTSYARAGYVNNPGRFGTLTGALAAWGGGTAQDNTNTISVTMPNGGTLSSVDNATAAAGLNLISIVNPDGTVEMISFQTATLTGPGAYNLTGLYRGLYGTVPGSHLSGASWGKLDNAAFRYQIPASQVGSMLYIKLVSFNIYGGGLRQISAETAYTFTPTLQTLPAPSSVTVQVANTPFW